MNPRRRLDLRREAVVELTPDQLRGVSGADSLNCHVTNISCVRCPSVPFENCPSFPLGDCTLLTETDTVTCQTDVC